MPTRKVLLIDDEEDFVITLAERLQLRGMQIITATDGETGLNLIENEYFDAVILDVLMPGLGGFEVLERIKSINSTLPVIIVTGHGSLTEGPEGIKSGAFDYIMKPFDLDDLIQKIEEAVHNK
jgi:DNA-binding NtrC family response regulator